jgi:hypothetical protein
MRRVRFAGAVKRGGSVGFRRFHRCYTGMCTLVWTFRRSTWCWRVAAAPIVFLGRVIVPGTGRRAREIADSLLAPRAVCRGRSIYRVFSGGHSGVTDSCCSSLVRAAKSAGLGRSCVAVLYPPSPAPRRRRADKSPLDPTPVPREQNVVSLRLRSAAIGISSARSAARDAATCGSARRRRRRSSRRRGARRERSARRRVRSRVRRARRPPSPRSSARSPPRMAGLRVLPVVAGVMIPTPTGSAPSGSECRAPSRRRSAVGAAAERVQQRESVSFVKPKRHWEIWLMSCQPREAGKSVRELRGARPTSVHTHASHLRHRGVHVAALGVARALATCPTKVAST